jgi:hypothetical protein
MPMTTERVMVVILHRWATATVEFSIVFLFLYILACTPLPF